MSLSIENLKFSYGDIQILKGLNFNADKGEFISVLGGNGAGKSTLFKCILGILKGYEGRILSDGEEIKNLSAKELSKKIAYLPQSHYPTFNYSVFDMVLMGANNNLSSLNSPKQEEKLRAMDALSRVGIEHLKNRGYARISGGERQLVLMARAITQNSKIWILDEPTSNLDYGNQIRILRQLGKRSKEGYLIIQSTHNPNHAYQFSDKVMVLKDGKSIAFGKPKDVIKEDIINDIYGVDVEIMSFYEDRLSMIVPKI